MRDGAIVDQQRRALIAHAGTGSGADTDQAVFGDLARLQPQQLAHLIHQGLAAQHAVGDVVGEQHAVFAVRLQVQERVERGHAFDAGAGNG